MTLGKPGRPKPWRVIHNGAGEIFVDTGAGAGVLLTKWTPGVWGCLSDMQREEDRVLALERGSAINHGTEWFDHYGNRHVGMKNILRNPLTWDADASLDR